MRSPLWLCFFCLCPAAAAAGEIASAYSRFDLEKTCRQVEKGDEYVSAGTWSCGGKEGPEVLVAISDDRSFVGFGRKAAESCAFRKTFDRFNTALSPVEWRISGGKPFAAIERWRVVTDEEGGTQTWLVITALKGDGACHVHYVAGSYPDANEHARRAADDLVPDFDCENDVPTVDSKVGPPGIAMVSCGELAAE
ncbi:hypothetical protein [Aestuariivirga sp.]|uniref:hypothetical protein n=1 Tax=Aestuariivirga sp. TaxID=2650926 RepID=UPI003919A87E